MAGRLMPQPVYPRLRKYACVPAASCQDQTRAAQQRHEVWIILSQHNGFDLAFAPDHQIHLAGSSKAVRVLKAS